MVTFPVDFPDTLGVQNFSMKLQNVVAVSRSPFSLKRQAVRYSGQAWTISASLPNQGRDTAEYYNAFLLKLDGKFGSFLMGDPAGVTPRGTWANAAGVKVNGAGQTGGTLVLDGFTASQTKIVKAGDYLQLGTGLNTFLYKVLDDANSDAGGNVTLNIAPRLRVSPADNADVIYTNARGIFNMNENTPGWDIDPEGAGNYTITFSATEAI